MSATAPTDAIASAIVTLLIDKYEAPEDTGPDSHFEDLGIDSLVLAEVAVDLSGTCGIRVEEHDLSSAGTPAAAAEVLRAKGAAV
jgi:acyl carrier protein